MWTPCPRNQHAYSCCRSRNPSYLPDLASGNHARGSRDIVVSKIRHGAFSTFCRRILRGGYTAWRILRSGTKEGPAGWSFDPSAEGAMATARPPLPLLICPSLSFCHLTAVALRVVTYSSRRSLIVRTLCQRREEWDYDPPAVLTGNFYWLPFFVSDRRWSSYRTLYQVGWASIIKALRSFHLCLGVRQYTTAHRVLMHKKQDSWSRLDFLIREWVRSTLTSV